MESCAIIAIEGAGTREFSLASFASARDRGRSDTAVMILNLFLFANTSHVINLWQITYRLIVFPGSFNPPHAGHMGLMEAGFKFLAPKFMQHITKQHITMVDIFIHASK